MGQVIKCIILEWGDYGMNQYNPFYRPLLEVHFSLWSVSTDV